MRFPKTRSVVINPSLLHYSQILQASSVSVNINYYYANLQDDGYIFIRVIDVLDPRGDMKQDGKDL